MRYGRVVLRGLVRLRRRARVRLGAVCRHRSRDDRAKRGDRGSEEHRSSTPSAAQHERLRRMARRLSADTNLDKYAVA